MTETLKSVITEVGEISGRDAIFLDKVKVIDEFTFELTGEFMANLCSNLSDTDRHYNLTFNGVHFFEMTELDFYDREYNSSFDIIENSVRVSKMVQMDKVRGIGKIDPSFQHFVFVTYDTVFEVICKHYALRLL